MAWQPFAISHSGSHANYLAEAATGCRLENTENEPFQQSILEFV